MLVIRSTLLFPLFPTLEEFDHARTSDPLARFIRSEDGPTAVEYAVMLALILIVWLTAISAIGTNANTTFDNISKSLK